MSENASLYHQRCRNLPPCGLGKICPLNAITSVDLSLCDACVICVVVADSHSTPGINTRKPILCERVSFRMPDQKRRMIRGCFRVFYLSVPLTSTSLPARHHRPNLRLDVPRQNPPASLVEEGRCDSIPQPVVIGPQDIDEQL